MCSYCSFPAPGIWCRTAVLCHVDIVTESFIHGKDCGDYGNFARHWSPHSAEVGGERCAWRCITIEMSRHAIGACRGSEARLFRDAGSSRCFATRRGPQEQLLIEFVKSQNITLDYSEAIAP